MRKDAKHNLEMGANGETQAERSSSLNPAQTDENIKSSFENSYVYKMFFKDSSVKTEAKAGFVTLTGTVAGEFHKELAQATIANLPGVIRVDNQLVTKAEVATQSADYWIGKKITLTLLFHRNVNASGTIVEVKDGVVTLRGEAANRAQMELTAEYAKDIEGVKAVKMEMKVAPTPEPTKRTLAEKIDDASVTAQVKMALFTHRSTSSIKTTVQTRNGEITLSGIARNEAEKSMVTKLAGDIHGVTSVKNQMTVQESKAR